MRAGISVLLASVLAAGCATLGPAPPATASAAAEAVAAGEVRASDADLGAYILRVRELSRRARPGGMTGGVVAEYWSKDLADAVSRFDRDPSVPHEIALAQAYVRAGILDHAHQHFANVARVDPREGAAWDGLARVWRDWGFPHFGLGDAYRAASVAPRSPMVRNTLGTILQYLGNGAAARAQFEFALALDPGAAYALNNICYSRLMEADAASAAAACGRALALDPGLVPARNNLALVMAVQGDLDGAAAVFGEAGGEPAAEYNLGIVYLSQRRYAAAAAAFDRAARLQPGLAMADARARQARQQAAQAPDDERGTHERR
jgi:Flp pilus assembly protein TadD